MEIQAAVRLVQTKAGCDMICKQCGAVIATGFPDESAANRAAGLALEHAKSCKPNN